MKMEAPPPAGLSWRESSRHLGTRGTLCHLLNQPGLVQPCIVVPAPAQHPDCVCWLQLAPLRGGVAGEGQGSEVPDCTHSSMVGVHLHGC